MREAEAVHVTGQLRGQLAVAERPVALFGDAHPGAEMNFVDGNGRVRGIFGASLAPYIATWLAKTYGLQYVGYYLSLAAVLTLIGLLATRETKDDVL